ncbi:MAG: DinB family protein [Bacteroidota bacterium]
MRQISILFLLLLNGFQLAGQDFGIDKSERKFLLNFLEASERDLISVIEPMTEEQWRSSAVPDSWSPSQCMSHILQAEHGLFSNIQMLLKTPANFEQDLSPNDAWLIGKIADRGVKVKTPLPEQPEIMTKEEALQALKKSRANIRAFLKDTELPLRGHIGKSPYGPADSYQLFLVIAAHSLRHKAQIDELLAGL